MKVLDCHMSYGATNNGMPYQNCDTFEQLCSTMKTAGVNGGLVRCGYSSTAGVVYGNNKVALDLTSEQSGHFQLWGVWALLPPYTNEIAEPAKLPNLMAQNRIAALYLDPVSHRYVPNKVSIGAYLAMAQECRIPVILNTSFGLTMEQIGNLLGCFPKLTAVIGDMDCWPNARRLYPLAYTYENVYLDLAYVMDDQGIEDMTARFGAEKLLFGTAFPERYIGSQMAMVRAAMIRDEDKEKIFGGNLERIIEREALR